MNIENLKKAAELIKGIDKRFFDMCMYRGDMESYKAECNTVGCVIGHCTVLDAENFDKNFATEIDDDKIMSFMNWSMEFFDLKHDIGKTWEPTPDSENARLWDYMFSDEWSYIAICNTPEHAVYRIQRVIDGYKPDIIENEIENEYENEYENE